jgi:uncharacterized protein (DUF2384 family)
MQASFHRWEFRNSETSAKRHRRFVGILKVLTHCHSTTYFLLSKTGELLKRRGLAPSSFRRRHHRHGELSSSPSFSQVDKETGRAKGIIELLLDIG